MTYQLPIPPQTEGDSQATEMIRVWLANDTVHISLLLGMWEDAERSGIDEGEAWGNLLADVARHIADGLSKSHGRKEADTLALIKQAFVENMEHYQARSEGRYVDN